jgi:tripartite-type tricarboxylate transporter receptor subunit TctC
MGIELLKQMGGLDILHVPYKSNPQVVTALLASEIDMATVESAVVASLPVDKVRALAVTSQMSLPHLPSLPTVDASGLKGYEMSSWTAVYLPKGASPELVQQLNRLFVKFMSAPAMEQMLKTSGTTRVTSTPEGLAKFQAEESEKWKLVIQRAGIVPE